MRHQKKQISIVLVTTLVLIALVAFVSWQNDRKFLAAETSKFQSNQLGFVRLTAERLQTKFEKLHDALYSLSQIPKVQFLDKNSCLFNMERAVKMNQRLVDGIFRVDADNRVRYAYPGDAQAPTRADLQSIFHQAQATGIPLVKVIRRQHNGTDILVVARPVYTVQGEVHMNPSNKFSGLILFTLSLHRLRKEFLAVSVFGGDGYAWMIDDQGLLVGASKQSHLGKRIDELLPLTSASVEQQAFLKLVEKMLAGQAGTTTVSSDFLSVKPPSRPVEGYFNETTRTVTNREQKLIAFTPLRMQRQTWSVALSNPASDVTVAIDQAIIERWFHSLIIVCIILTMAALLIVIMRSNHGRQMRALQEREEALREAEEKYRTLVEDANDAIIILQHSKTVYCNPAILEALGYTADDVLGHSFLDFVAPEDRDRVHQNYTKRLEGKDVPEQYEVNLLDRNGELVTMEIRPRVIQYQGQPATMVVMRNVTERKRLESQLRQAHKIKAIGTLAGGIAHDFNNILTAIMGYTELSQYDVAEDTQVWHNLQEVLTAAKRAQDLVAQILTFSRQTEQERRPLQPHLIVKEALKLIRASLPSTIEIRQHIATESGTIFADPTQMHQVMMNLCTNAAHAMHENGGLLEIDLDSLDVDASWSSNHAKLTPGPYVRLTVRDTGHGMTPEVIERVFEPFFTTKAPGAGTGMGLAVVHGIVASHGGTITIESQSGSGTTVAVYLPRTEADPISESSEERSVPVGKERILFVDDEESLTNLGKHLLERLGYRVTAYNSSVGALAAFRNAPDDFDLVITDYTMPQMTGEDLTRELRLIRPDIPVILCTGHSQTMNAEKACAMGNQAFYTKPLRAKELGLIVRQVLEQKTPPQDQSQMTVALPQQG